MPDIIQLRAKTNKDLLIMTVMQGNETVRHLEIINSTLKNHEKRLIIIEARNGKPVNLSKKQAVGLGSAMFIFGSFIDLVNALVIKFAA